MIRRNGSMPKVIGGVVLFFAAVYLVYSLNDLSGQLKDTERTAERYRREHESVAAQLQGKRIKILIYSYCYSLLIGVIPYIQGINTFIYIYVNYWW